MAGYYVVCWYPLESSSQVDAVCDALFPTSSVFETDDAVVVAGLDVPFHSDAPVGPALVAAALAAVPRVPGAGEPEVRTITTAPDQSIVWMADR